MLPQFFCLTSSERISQQTDPNFCLFDTDSVESNTCCNDLAIRRSLSLDST
jgi:hypothetical protein